ncbi:MULTISPECIES: hypothetical protein [unclassified Polaromonas]|uniref:hypothetical protein n=1 Tax=unclassified Polaromonas TaxID=2638319 RepID=UPI0018CA779E|nr:MULTISPECIES: hypothetical protein [unclassified Polaromonas]MBG6071266.1 putative permease [Polaromonas sp. CG_9.7]MBG6113266.1 putative permease [Polaromonas sp. CG_9.2]MDH6185801.1 putative permease [Polaromonas sp. CG_23.6]
MLRKPFVSVLLAGAALAGSASAWAHGNFGADTSIWTASAHLFTSPLSLAALIGLALVLFGIREPLSVLAAALAAASAVVATAFSAHIPAVVAPAAVVVIGLSAVAGWRPSAAFSLLLALLAGLAAGSAADLEQPRWQELTGMAVTVMVCAFWLLAVSDNLNRSGRFQTLIPLARRVLGSWVAAIALLLGALALVAKNT